MFKFKVGDLVREYTGNIETVTKRKKIEGVNYYYLKDGFFRFPENHLREVLNKVFLYEVGDTFTMKDLYVRRIVKRERRREGNVYFVDHRVLPFTEQCITEHLTKIEKEKIMRDAKGCILEHGDKVIAILDGVRIDDARIYKMPGGSFYVSQNLIGSTKQGEDNQGYRYIKLLNKGDYVEKAHGLIVNVGDKVKRTGGKINTVASACAYGCSLICDKIGFISSVTYEDLEKKYKICSRFGEKKAPKPEKLNLEISLPMAKDMIAGQLECEPDQITIEGR